jgi:hypothetical protein
MLIRMISPGSAQHRAVVSLTLAAPRETLVPEPPDLLPGAGMTALQEDEAELGSARSVLIRASALLQAFSPEHPVLSLGDLAASANLRAPAALRHLRVLRRLAAS